LAAGARLTHRCAHDHLQFMRLQVAREVLTGRGERLFAENATGKPEGVAGGPEWEAQEERASWVTGPGTGGNVTGGSAHLSQSGGHGHR
jgi:hypothetical protein